MLPHKNLQMKRFTMKVALMVTIILKIPTVIYFFIQNRCRLTHTHRFCGKNTNIQFPYIMCLLG